MPGTILLVDVVAAERLALREHLNAQGHEVLEASGARDALEKAEAHVPDAVVLDGMGPDNRGEELVLRLRGAGSTAAIIILCSPGHVAVGVEAVRLGAHHLLTRPIDTSQLARVLDAALTRTRSSTPLGFSAQGPRPFVGNSAVMRALHDQCLRVVRSDSPVLIRGETGTGKGVLARWLRMQGPRANGPFVDVNCAGLAREFLESELFGHTRGAFTGAAAAKTGLLEVAHRGTLFLDEIGDMSLDIQAKVLKVVEEKMFRRMGGVREEHTDVLIVAATLQNLEKMVEEGRFRRDLYYRIGAISLEVPPLRKRREDIVPLARELLGAICVRAGRPVIPLAEDAETALTEHDWPGNVRELKNVLERGVLMTDGSVLRAEALRLAGPVAPEGWTTSQHWTLVDCERAHIARVLQAEKGRVDTAARRLGIGRSTLYQKIQRFGLGRS